MLILGPKGLGYTSACQVDYLKGLVIPEMIDRGVSMLRCHGIMSGVGSIDVRIRILTCLDVEGRVPECFKWKVQCRFYNFQVGNV